MSNVVMHLQDQSIVRDFCNLNPDTKDYIREKTFGGPKKTKVIFKNHDTGEILGEYENKVVISGSQFQAMSVFGITDKTVPFTSYNADMKLDNYRPDTDVPMHTPTVCLFGVSDSGCGTNPQDVKVSKNTDRIKPGPSSVSSQSDALNKFKSDVLMPFRFVNTGSDLDANLRKYYFGRKTFSNIGKVAYYFKTFDTNPQLHIRYADGTQVTGWDPNATQACECYVEMRLRITRLDFRDYFQYIGWNKARISSLSLCSAWYDDTTYSYKFYNDILPYTLLNFSYRPLADSTIAIDIIYSIFY